MKNIFKRIYHSPTLNTWGSFAAKALSLIIVLPLVLNRFTTAEISIWYLFMTIISMQMLADIGFSVTFIRVIAFAAGGAPTKASLVDREGTRLPRNSKQPPGPESP